MAKVRVQVAGGSQQEIEASDVGEAREKCGADDGFKASVNGEAAEDDMQLRNNDFVSFSKPVKAG